MRRVIGVALACAVIGLAGLSIAPVTAVAQAPTRHIGFSGGRLAFIGDVKRTTTCVWSARPLVPGFDVTTSCRNGDTRRTATFAANTSVSTKHYLITLAVRGNPELVYRWNVIQAGKAATAKPNASFKVTGLSFQDFGMGNTFVYGTFKNISSMTLTDNAGHSCKAVLGGLDIPAPPPLIGPPVYSCKVPFPIISGSLSWFFTKFTSLTVSSPGLPSQTISWKTLTPTVAIVPDQSGGSTLSVTSGEFFGNFVNQAGQVTGGSVALRGTRTSGTGLFSSCQMALVTPDQLSSVSCQTNESVATLESYTIGVDWSGTANYVINAAQNVPVVVLSEVLAMVQVTYDSSTNLWDNWSAIGVG